MVNDNNKEDDGRVVADMNFEGAPWYRKKRKNLESVERYDLNLTKKETISLMKSALLAGLLVGFVFILAFFLFILFSTEVWLKP
jgi:hypothetical protein